MSVNTLYGEPFTYRDWMRMPEDGNRYEVLGGMMVKEPPPSTHHQGVSGNLFKVLAKHLDDHGIGGALFTAPVGIVFSKFDAVEPDLVYVSPERTGMIRKQFVRGAPDIVVEILSPSTTRRDREKKAEIYARYGVKEYWILDPADETVELLVPDPAQEHARFRTAGIFRREETFTTALLPGLTVEVAKIFERPWERRAACERGGQQS